MIPKKIHYCWFGGNPLPEKLQMCIESWYKFLPDFEIIRWDEANFDVHQIPFSSQAYQARKFAFVSDYARFKILNEQGGIYMDTDVELLSSLNPFLHHRVFTGFERKDLVAPGLILGAIPQQEIIQYMQNYYEALPAYTAQSDTVVTIMTNYLREKGLRPDNSMQHIAETTVYPMEYFAPMNFQNNTLAITNNTVSIHHYAGTWLSDSEKNKVKLYQLLNKLLGEKLFRKLRNATK